MDHRFESLSQTIQGLIEITDISGDFRGSEGDEDQWDPFPELSSGPIPGHGDGADGEEDESASSDEEAEDADGGDVFPEALDVPEDVPKPVQVGHAAVNPPPALERAIKEDQAKLRITNLLSLESYLDRVVSHMVALESVRANLERLIK